VKHLATLCALVVFGAESLSQGLPLTWSGQLRLRGEVDGRDFNASNAYNAYSLSRIRLGLQATPVDGITVFLQAEDSRVFGEEKDPAGQFSTVANTRNLDLHQGYVHIDRLFADPVSVRAGRMQLRYGNERIIGAVDWNNVGRSFDGILARYSRGASFVDAFAMNTGETNTPPASATPSSVAGKRDEGQALYGAYGSFDIDEAFGLDVYALYQTNLKQTTPGEPDLLRLTAGAAATIRLAAATVELEGSYQTGDQGTRSVSAYLAAGAVQYRTGMDWLTSVRGSVEALSGTPEGDPDAKTFDPPYATGHKFHGWMDYFVNIPSQTFDRGLLDVNAALAGKLAEPVSWTLKGHSFSLMQPRDGSRALGQEIDFLVTWTYAQPLSFDLGGGAFFPGVNMEEAFKGSDVGLWAYLAVTVSF
jgi:hypothetical protein